MSIGKRESDIFDLFQEAVTTPNDPQLLVRAEKIWKRIIEQGSFSAAVAAHKAAGSLEIRVPRRAPRKARGP